MTFNDSSRLDPSQVEDARGRGGVGGPILVGGGGIGLLILVASLLLGVDPFAGDVSSGPIEGVPSVQECRTGADANRRTDCRIVGFVDSIQKYWGAEFDRRGDTYLPAHTVIYTGAVDAGCGIASAAEGPFYCPSDGKVYLDLSFFDELPKGPSGKIVKREISLPAVTSTSSGPRMRSAARELQEDVG